MTTQVSRAASLEESGQWLPAVKCLVHYIRSGNSGDADIWHRVGRLHQRLGNLPEARRAYSTALFLDPCLPRTCNNYALLELGCLNATEAERWLMQGLACQSLHVDDEELLLATACDLRLYQLRPALRCVM